MVSNLLKWASRTLPSRARSASDCTGALSTTTIIASSAAPTRSKIGRIPLADGAGVVEAVGEGVTEFAAGDHVVSCFFPLWLDGPPAFGDFATVPGDGVDGYAREIVVRPASWFTRAPRGFSHAQAATLTTAGLTAWRALVADGGLKAGDTILVLGTGGVSTFAVHFAKTMGATVIATSSSDEKLERVRCLGADHTIDSENSEPQWGNAVSRLTDGRGVVGVNRVWRAGYACAIDRGGADRRAYLADRDRHRIER